VLAVFAAMEIRAELRDPKSVGHGRVKLVLGIIVLMGIFVAVLPLAGFFFATAILLLGGIYAIGYRRHIVVATVAVAVLAFCYVVFIHILGLPLPMGSLFQ